MKVIFLDFDGVIHVPTRSGKNFGSYQINNLNLAIESTGAKIVITSSWRDNFNIFALKNILCAAGMCQNDIIGVIPKGEKQDGIKDWLANHSEVSSFVVVDDDELKLKNIVTCEPLDGLTFSKSKEIIKKLNIDK